MNTKGVPPLPEIEPVVVTAHGTLALKIRRLAERERLEPLELALTLMLVGLDAVESVPRSRETASRLARKMSDRQLPQPEDIRGMFVE